MRPRGSSRSQSRCSTRKQIEHVQAGSALQRKGNISDQVKTNARFQRWWRNNGDQRLRNTKTALGDDNSSVMIHMDVQRTYFHAQAKPNTDVKVPEKEQTEEGYTSFSHAVLLLLSRAGPHLCNVAPLPSPVAKLILIFFKVLWRPSSEF